MTEAEVSEDTHLPPPKARANRVVIAVAVVFLLAAGALGTLWFVERGDHRTAVDQLNSQLTDTQAKLDKAQKDVKEADARTMKAGSERGKLEDDLTQANLRIDSLSKDRSACDTAGRAYIHALNSRDNNTMDNAMSDVITNCR